MRHVPKSFRSHKHASEARKQLGEETERRMDDLDVNTEPPFPDRAAFLPDPGEGPAHSEDEVAEEFAERFLNSATSDADRDDASMQEPSVEEEGGPYVTSSEAEEFGGDPDGNNPRDAEPAAFPTTQSES